MEQHPTIKQVLESKLDKNTKIEKLKRMAYDAAEMQVADAENMGSDENGQPGVDEIVEALNKLSEKKYKVSDFFSV